MFGQLSPELEARTDLRPLVARADAVLFPLLRSHSQTAKALWSLVRDGAQRDVVVLTLNDPWGYSSGRFATGELGDEQVLGRRFHDLIGEMLAPTRTANARTRIEIRDALATTGQLENFRQRLNGIPRITEANVQLLNKVRFSPTNPEYLLLTDFAVEVNNNFADAVRAALRDSGFFLREAVPLLQQPGVREAIIRLVEKHKEDGQPVPEFVLCFRTADDRKIHLLEVSNQAEPLGDGSLEGVGFAAGHLVPGAQSVVLYLTHPDDLRTAHQQQPEHPLFRDLLSGSCVFILPNDGGAAFRSAFPDLFRGRA
jgi:hypothetical protein